MYGAQMLLQLQLCWHAYAAACATSRVAARCKTSNVPLAYSGEVLDKPASNTCHCAHYDAVENLHDSCVAVDTPGAYTLGALKPEAKIAMSKEKTKHSVVFERLCLRNSNFQVLPCSSSDLHKLNTSYVCKHHPYQDFAIMNCLRRTRAVVEGPKCSQQTINRTCCPQICCKWELLLDGCEPVQPFAAETDLYS